MPVSNLLPKLCVLVDVFRALCDWRMEALIELHEYCAYVTERRTRYKVRRG